MITANTCIPPVDAPDFISDIGNGSKHTPKEVLLRYLCQKGIQIVYDAEKLSDRLLKRNQKSIVYYQNFVVQT